MPDFNSIFRTVPWVFCASGANRTATPKGDLIPAVIVLTSHSQREIIEKAAAMPTCYLELARVAELLLALPSGHCSFGNSAQCNRVILNRVNVLMAGTLAYHVDS